MEEEYEINKGNKINKFVKIINSQKTERDKIREKFTPTPTNRNYNSIALAKTSNIDNGESSIINEIFCQDLRVPQTLELDSSLTITL